MNLFSSHKVGLVNYFGLFLKGKSLPPYEIGADKSNEISKIEAPRRKRQGIFPVRSLIYFLIRSLTPLQNAGNALAITGSSWEAEWPEALGHSAFVAALIVR
jgi:hypothetical protein